MTPLATFRGVFEHGNAAVITISAGGELLPDLLETVLTLVFAQPAAFLVMALAIGLIMADAAMNVSLARFTRTLKRL